jgi:hypothetical protein
MVVGLISCYSKRIWFNINYIMDNLKIIGRKWSKKN